MRTRPMYEQLVDRIEGDARLDGPAERLDVASAAIGEGTVAHGLRGDWMGHALHPVLTDLPIGCWTSAALLDLLGGRRSRATAQRLIGLGLLFVPATAASGLVDYREVPDRATQRVGTVHAVGNTLAAALYWSSWRRRRRGHHVQGIVMGLLGGGVATVTGYLGGHMASARATGTGPRGTLGPSRFERAPADRAMSDRAMSDRAMSDRAIDVDDLVDVVEASDLLAVPVDQVRAMAAGGVLTPVDDADPMRFALAEVLATRQLGG